MCTEPQQILLTAQGEKGLLRAFWKEVTPTSFPLCPWWSERWFTPIRFALSGRRPQAPPNPKSAQIPVQGPLRECSAQEACVESAGRSGMGFTHTPEGSSPPGTPKVNSTLQAFACWTVPSQTAVIEKGGGRGEGAGGDILPVCSSHQSRRHFLPFKIGPEGKCSANSCS